MTQVMKTSEVRKEWSQTLNNVFKDQIRIIVEKSGIPIAAVISAEDLERVTKIEKQRAERFKVLDEIGETFKDVPQEKLVTEITRAIKQVREDN